MTYPGGKNGAGVYQQIINQIPPHRIYIEPFLGAGAIMRLKRPADHSIGVDIDYAVMQTFEGKDLPHLTLLIANALTWMQTKTFQPDTFIYLDPPYLMASRSTRRKIYAHEFTDGNHRCLLSLIKTLPCMAMISGYPNAMYDVVLSSWRTHDFMTTNRGGGHVRERLWMNYPTPTQLHDYQYLGSTFREREKIKRQKARWVMRITKMDVIRRHALAAAIAEVDASGSYRLNQRTAPVRIETKEEIITALCEGFDDPPSGSIDGDTGTRSTEASRPVADEPDRTRKQPATGKE
jgi:hypothetical protein